MESTYTPLSTHRSTSKPSSSQKCLHSGQSTHGTISLLLSVVNWRPPCQGWAHQTIGRHAVKKKSAGPVHSRDLNVDLKSRGEWRRQIDASTKTPAGVRTPSTVMALHAIPLSWSPDMSFTSSKVYTGMESIQHPSPLQTMLGIARPPIFNKNNHTDMLTVEMVMTNDVFIFNVLHLEPPWHVKVSSVVTVMRTDTTEVKCTRALR